MKYAQRSFAPLAFASLLLSHQAVAFPLFTQVDLNVDRQELAPPGPNQSIFVDSQSSTSDSAPIGDAINPSVPFISPSAAARARPGVIRAGVNAEANIPGVSYLSSSGRAEARWTVRTVINLPGIQAGTAASIPAAVRFTGELGYRNNGYGAGTVYSGAGFLGLNLFGSNGGSGAADSGYTANYVDNITENNVNRLFRIQANQNGTVYFPVDTRPPGTRESYRVGETVEAMITFLTGVPFDVTTRLVANGVASVGDSGRLEWFSSALNSAAWDGFGDVLIGDVTYTDFTAIDQFSGLNLREPVRDDVPSNGVPAPGTLWLFGLSSPLLGAVAWSRRRGAGGQRAVDAVA